MEPVTTRVSSPWWNDYFLSSYFFRDFPIQNAEILVILMNKSQLYSFLRVCYRKKFFGAKSGDGLRVVCPYFFRVSYRMKIVFLSKIRRQPPKAINGLRVVCLNFFEFLRKKSVSGVPRIFFRPKKCQKTQNNGLFSPYQWLEYLLEYWGLNRDFTVQLHVFMKHTHFSIRNYLIVEPSMFLKIWPIWALKVS